MTTVYLYGHLGRRFGHRWRLEVKTPAEALRAIMANKPAFRAHLLKHNQPGYQVLVGTAPLETVDALQYPSGRQVIKIVPVVAGAGKDPVIGIIVGVVLVAAAVVSFQYEILPFALTTVGGGLTLAGSAVMSVGFIGASLAIGGLSQLLAGQPMDPGIGERPENQPSYMFDGAVNTLAQGHPVPVGYGRMRIGSAVISAGLATEEIAL